MPNPADSVIGFKARNIRAETVVLDDNNRDDVMFEISSRYRDTIQKLSILDKTYYTFPGSGASSGMGKSAKILLFSEDGLRQYFAENPSHDTPFKPKPNAILKLPKHGDINSVQNEAMALGIASALGHNTASATMVLYDANPSLFVPFDEMTPLNELSDGTETRVLGGGTNKSDSTLNPIGEGLQSNVFVDDFGDSFAMLYLSGDADAVGGYNQNKGIQGRSLYVFDQAIEPNNNYFKADRRLCCTSSYSIYAASRHTKGRNFSLLMDSSIERKFDSMSLDNLLKVNDYCQQVIDGLTPSRNTLQPFMRRAKAMSLTEHDAPLLKNAEKIAESIRARIESFRAMLPYAPGVEESIVKKTLILENLLNKPQLFMDNGRPLRNPLSTKDHDLGVVSIKKVSEEFYEIEFDGKIPFDRYSMLASKVGNAEHGLVQAPKLSSKSTSNVLSISATALNTLETNFFPENHLSFNPNVDYLSIQDLDFIQHAYSPANNGLMSVIAQYHSAKPPPPKEDSFVINNLTKTRAALGTLLPDSQSLLNNPKNGVGFTKHVIKKFEFELQGELQKLLSKNNDTETIDLLSNAFVTALKTDSMQEFNSFVLRLVDRYSNQPLPLEVKEFLHNNANFDERESDYIQAIQKKDEMHQTMQALAEKIFPCDPAISSNKGLTIKDFRAEVTNLREHEKSISTKADVVEQKKESSTTPPPRMTNL